MLLFNNKMSNDIKHTIAKNELNELFLSPSNIKIIQNGIRKQIYIKSLSKYNIGNQSERELTIVMRSIYLQYSKNLPTNITYQITELNNRVINYCVPNILSNIKQYISYKNNINKLPIPMILPQNMSNAGSKSLTNNYF